MDLKEDIFNELKAKKFKANFAWVFPMYNPFRCELPYTVSLEEFHRTMEELSNDGYFEIGEFMGHPKYTLTDKCEKYINS